MEGIQSQRIRRILVHGYHVREPRMTHVQHLPENCSAASALRLALNMKSNPAPVESTAR
jgi:hypothetical protein